MTSEFVRRLCRAAFAMYCVLATAAPAAAQAQQPPASRHAYLGAELRDLTLEEAARLGRQVPHGTAVKEVEANSPAATAGFKPGDIVLEINGRTIANAAQFLKVIASKTPGTVVTVRLLRQGKHRAGPVKLGAKPDEQAAAAAVPAKPGRAIVSARTTSEVPKLAPQSQTAPAVEYRSNPAARVEPRAEVVPQTGHGNTLSTVALSADGRIALSGAHDKTLKLWDTATGKVLRTFVGHTGNISSTAISLDGRTALSGSEDQTLKLWDTTTGQELRTLTGHTGEVNSVALSADGRTALSGGGRPVQRGELKLWDTVAGKELRSFAVHTNGVRSVALSPDGHTALASSWNKTLTLWDTTSGKELLTFKGLTDYIQSLAFSLDGHFILTGSNDRTVKLWDAATGKELRTFEGHTGPVVSVALSPDGRTALSGSGEMAAGGEIKLWDAATGKEVRTFAGNIGDYKSVAFARDSRTALSASGYDKLKLWDTATGKELHTLTGHTKCVRSVALSPDGHTALSASDDSTLKVWDIATGRELRTLTGHTGWVHSVAFSPDGRTALSGAEDETLKLWDAGAWKELRTFTGHTNHAASVAFFPDGRTALSGSWDNTLKLWDVASGKELRAFTGHDGAVNSIAVSADGRTAFSGGVGDTLIVWDVAAGRELRAFPTGHSKSVQSVALSPDGQTALSGSWDNTLKLWDTATGKELRTLTGHTDSVWPAAFSPDGRTILSGGYDNTLRLWDAATGQQLRSFTGHAGAITSVVFPPDRRLALSGSQDGTIRFWDIERGRELVRMTGSPDGEWLTITPEGFFSSSHRDTEMLAIVRGMEVTTIGQVHQSLFNPDLVREALAGDPDGEVQRAAEVVSLDKVLDAGPPPAAAITSHEPASHSGAGLVTVAARITDRGKGIGRIEWRVNGVTASVMAAPAGPGPDYEVTQQVALDPGENQIEVIAYEKRNLLASLPGRTTIAYDGAADIQKPKLHILAIGVNAYEDKGWLAPGAKEATRFPPLNLAAGDATAFAAEMKKAASGLYGEVRVRTALDHEATPANLDRIVREMAAEISPRDTFVLLCRRTRLLQ